MYPTPYTRAIVVLAIVAAMTAFVVKAADARPMPGPDVRQTSSWSADIAPAWPLAPASTLCRGFHPSDLEAWDIETGARIGDDRLRYVPALLPGLIPPLVVSGYPRPVRVFGWCG